MWKCTEEYGDPWGYVSPKYKNLRKRVGRPKNVYGRSACDIALELGVSIRTVQRWRKLQRANLRAVQDKGNDRAEGARSATTKSAKDTR